MNRLQIKGDWNILKGQLKKEFAFLTDDDLVYREGEEDELVGRLQRALGKSRRQIAAMFSSGPEHR
jgi:uncharacterized protein YjbJ (UPF0337 family)